ncbi:lantibiotic dehydratase family protein [Aquimarina sp. ERC-38]|uniref:lantibiotic dehydratase family protein n=1 Tax=Aquimarina sp. ERC-38 TaxID=2949996 RepID=UPI002245C933|nr:lantibiotic dehydratase family protein [Aquimarina sp. ERC-38]UZO81726.1 lantibiotic dehydratase family protein [Aquimarina sp. ERC-38]
MKPENPYLFLEKACLRTPVFPISLYIEFFENEGVNRDFLAEFWNNTIFKEALFIASPALYEQWKRWNDATTTFSKKESDKLRYAILKYITRSTSRCTPFGLFAGCSMISFDKSTQMELGFSKEYRRQTRLDMNLLVSLSQKLAEDVAIKKRLQWFPNSSLYRIGSQYRYVEYSYNEKADREHAIEAIYDSEYVSKILDVAKKGTSLQTLVKLLCKDPDISEEVATEFIDQLISNQILVSELEPALTGSDLLTGVKNILQDIVPANLITKTLSRFIQELSKIDHVVSNSVAIYSDLLNLIDTLQIKTDHKYKLQTDLYPVVTKKSIAKKWGYKTAKLLAFFSKITPAPRETNLDIFRNAFVKRYETREVPLTTALDTEVGIGYLQNQEASDTTPFLDDLNIPIRYSEQKSYTKSTFQEILEKKLKESKNTYQIEILAEDIASFPEHYDDLPDTMSAMGTLLKINGEERMFLSSIGGSSAANLLGRFTTGHPEIREQVNKIVSIEENNDKECILAEIIHLPQSRTGNILKREVNRDYEIPYLAKSSLPVDQQILVEDLLISVKNNRIVLRSKKLNKEVKPRLSNAHNYSYNALPIYQFVCDLQNQNKRSSVGFNWGSFLEENTFLPRVCYRDFIISKAQWKFRVKDIKPNFTKINEDQQAFTEWKKQWQIPQYFSLVDGDNTLLIDSDNSTCLHMLWDTVKNRNTCYFEEFLSLPEHCVVQNKEKKPFTNQIIISLYKNMDHTSNN